MSTANSDLNLFSGQFNAQIFVAIFVPAIFLLIIILTMLVFLLYRQPSDYDAYVQNLRDTRDDQEKYHSRFEIISREPLSYP